VCCKIRGIDSVRLQTSGLVRQGFLEGAVHEKVGAE
jgi:hypothetical protein